MPVAFPRSKVKKNQTWNAESVFDVPKPLTDHQRYAKLRAGSHRFAQEVFPIAGVDMAGTRPIEDAFEILENYIDRLETLTSN